MAELNKSWDIGAGTLIDGHLIYVDCVETVRAIFVALCMKISWHDGSLVMIERARLWEWKGAKATAIHYGDIIMDTMASQITSLTIVYSIVYSGADQRKHQKSTSLAFVRGIHRGPGNSPRKWPVTRKMFPFDDVIMQSLEYWLLSLIWATNHQNMY